MYKNCWPVLQSVLKTSQIRIVPLRLGELCQLEKYSRLNFNLSHLRSKIGIYNIYQEKLNSKSGYVQKIVAYFAVNFKNKSSSYCSTTFRSIVYMEKILYTEFHYKSSLNANLYIRYIYKENTNSDRGM